MVARLGSVGTGDNDKVEGLGRRRFAQERSERLAKTAADTVAHHRVADLFAHNDSDPHDAVAVRLPAQTKQLAATRAAPLEPTKRSVAFKRD